MIMIIIIIIIIVIKLRRLVKILPEGGKTERNNDKNDQTLENVYTQIPRQT